MVRMMYVMKVKQYFQIIKMSGESTDFLLFSSDQLCSLIVVLMDDCFPFI